MKATAAAKPTPQSGQAMRTLLFCLLGVLIPRAVLYGQMAPFGVSLAAAVGSAPVTIAAALGYLLAGDVLLPLRYITAVAMVGAGRWVLAAIPRLHRHPACGAALSFVSVVSTGLVILGQTGLDAFRVLLIVAEGILAAGCSLCFSSSARVLATDNGEGISLAGQASLILTGAVAIAAVSSLQIGGFSPGRILAAGLILILARSGREVGGSIAGVVIGAMSALTAPNQTALAVSLAFGGLVAGLFSRIGKLMQAAAFLLAAGVVSLTQSDDAILWYLYEIAAAGILFVLLPRRFDHALGHLFIRNADLPAVQGFRRAATLRLQVAAEALGDVADTVETVSARLAQHSAPDTATLLRGSRESVCGACPMHAVCWEQQRTETLAALDTLLPLLRQQGHITAAQLDLCPQLSCRQKERLADYINHSYTRYAMQEEAWQRLAELRGALYSQWSGVGDLLTALAEDLDDRTQIDTDLSARIAALCADHGMPVREALCLRRRNNRLTVEIVAADVGVRLDGGRWLQEMQSICARTFAPPVTQELGADVRITLTERARYAVECGVAQRCCDGERLCGDATDRFSSHGQTVTLISDGMGSGGRAAVDGAMTAGLTARLWQAGFSPDSILRTVNAALLIKSREESLATLDVAVIDEFSGRLDCYKAGAATTLLRSGDRISRIERPGLPIGILPEVSFEHCHDWLAAGDILLMMSDGALVDGVASVEQLLADHPHSDSMQMLADCVADAAHTAGRAHPDDITVVALRLIKL